MNWKTGIYLSDEAKDLLWKTAFFVFLGIGVSLSYIAFAKNNIFVLIFGVLPCALGVGILAVIVWLPRIGNWVGFGFLFPRKFLKKAPLVLSPYWGMLTQRDYAGILSEVSPLLQENIGNPDLVYLYAQACLNSSGFEQTGFVVMEQHFSLQERETSKKHMDLLFYYADKAVEYRVTGNLQYILEAELHTDFYTDTEKRMIELRLNSVRRV